MAAFAPQPLFLLQHAQLLNSSYEQLLGKPLLSVTDGNIAAALWHAPFALVSHNSAIDPIFNYANATALALFEFTWDEFIHLPSKLSAEPVNQSERDALLTKVREQGYIADYQGIRLSKTGRRFQINQAVVWNIVDQHEQYCGQAACFHEWIYL